MGAKADHDLLGQAMAAERQYGDRAPEVITKKAQALRKDGEYSEADFWTQEGTPNEPRIWNQSSSHTRA